MHKIESNSSVMYIKFHNKLITNQKIKKNELFHLTTSLLSTHFANLLPVFGILQV